MDSAKCVVNGHKVIGNRIIIIIIIISMTYIFTPRPLEFHSNDMALSILINCVTRALMLIEFHNFI